MTTKRLRGAHGSHGEGHSHPDCYPRAISRRERRLEAFRVVVMTTPFDEAAVTRAAVLNNQAADLVWRLHRQMEEQYTNIDADESNADWLRHGPV